MREIMKKVRVWVGRRDDLTYEFGTSNEFNHEDGFSDRSYVCWFDADEFKELFPHLTLKPGECKEVTIDARFVEKK